MSNNIDRYLALYEELTLCKDEKEYQDVLERADHLYKEMSDEEIIAAEQKIDEMQSIEPAYTTKTKK